MAWLPSRKHNAVGGKAVRMYEQRTSYTLWVKREASAATMKISMEVPKKFNPQIG